MNFYYSEGTGGRTCFCARGEIDGNNEKDQEEMSLPWVHIEFVAMLSLNWGSLMWIYLTNQNSGLLWKFDLEGDLWIT